MKKYSSLWTQFETQSLAFGLLRKALYPQYLVRGDFGKIEIYKSMLDKSNPLHILTIRVHASTKKEDDCFQQIGDNEFNLVGGHSAMDVVVLIIPELTARAASAEHSAPSPS